MNIYTGYCIYLTDVIIRQIEKSTYNLQNAQVKSLIIETRIFVFIIRKI